MVSRQSYPAASSQVSIYTSRSISVEIQLSSTAADNPCENNSCDHICLMNDLENGYSCVCAQGYTIESDGLSCKGELTIA